MPIGIILDAACVIIGTLIGLGIGKHIPEKMKESMTIVFGLVCFSLGISFLIEINSIVAVAIALILGIVVGEMFDIQGRLIRMTGKLQGAMTKSKNPGEADKVIKGVVSLLPLFCINATMIIGGMNEAVGNHTPMFLKAVLDFFTAIVFTANYGYAIGFLSVPLLMIGMLFFALSSLLLPILTPSVLADLNATGGIQCFAIALGVIGIKHVRVNNIIPSLVLVVPISILWSMIA